MQCKLSVPGRVRGATKMNLQIIPGSTVGAGARLIMPEAHGIHRMASSHELAGEDTARASLNAQHADDLYSRNNAEQQRMVASDGQAGAGMAEWCSC